MRCLVLSDLHRERWRDGGPAFDASVSRPDVVILAGDIDKGDRAVGWAAQTFRPIPVLYVAGNHEYYGKTVDSVEAQIRRATARHPNVHFLQCDDIVIDGVRFLGATLWTDFGLFGEPKRRAAMQAAGPAMEDYWRIKRVDYRKMLPEDTKRVHHLHRAWLEHQLRQRTAARATVVITHMAPSLRSVPNQFANDPVSAAFASALDHLVDMCDVYVHGHMHQCRDYPIGRGRVICNPRGYRLRDGSMENPDFNAHFVVDV